MRLVVEQVVVGRRMEAVFEGQDEMTTWCFSIKDGVRMVELVEYLYSLRTNNSGDPRYRQTSFRVPVGGSGGWDLTPARGRETTIATCFTAPGETRTKRQERRVGW